MRLLVSARSAEEAVEASEGGADVIDAKEPDAGALGAVRPDVLREIRAAVPSHQLVTAALGDADDAGTIEHLARVYAASGATFVKVGFAGVADAALVEALIGACVRGCRDAGDGGNGASGVIAVAYADAPAGTSIDAMVLPAIAARAGARGVLVDTVDKQGAGLTALWTVAELSAWVARVRECGLLAAVAGRLTLGDLAIVRDAGADIAGVRGAACAGGRSGRVSVNRVRELRVSLDLLGAARHRVSRARPR
jgi:(5-formylfuran-3-yl)methyl phosphate synthase